MKFLSAIFIFISSCLNGAFVDYSSAYRAAQAKLSSDRMTGQHYFSGSIAILSTSSSDTLAYVFELDPTGYIIVTADDELFPIIAYSYDNGCRASGEEDNILFSLVRMDIELKKAGLNEIPPSVLLRFKSQWKSLLEENREHMNFPFFEQWPPAGSTPTGGWLMSNWTQNSPYNSMCPIDPQTAQRSIAGCPAVAMGMIVNYHEEIHGTRFSDADDYYHSYAGRNYWIDDDWAVRGFPSWSQLNVYFDTLESHYSTGDSLTNQDKAALVWACGAAMRQVYTSGGSGTFGATQALNAYIKFGYGDCSPLDTLSDSLYERLSQNMKDGMPAHITALTPPPVQGHNFVIDGYNTNDYYHLNMGWGGTHNGWYIIPDSIPYNLTVIDTIFIDIGDPLNFVEESPSGPVSAEFERSSFYLTAQNPLIFFFAPCSGPAQVSIYDLTGRLAQPPENIFLEKGSNLYRVHIEDLSSGAYFFSVCSEKGFSNCRFTYLK